jgi:hypothetical protein
LPDGEELMAMPEAHFCPHCGSSVGGSDLFCRRCGTRIADAEANSAASPDESASTKRGLRRRKVLLPLFALTALVVAIAAVAGFTVLSGSEEATAAEKQQAQSEVLRARLRPPYEAIMQLRTSYFSAERQYLAGMTDARRSLRKYKQGLARYQAEITAIDRANEAQWELCRTYAEVDCPNPTYPDSPEVPDLDGNVEKIRAAARPLDQIKADLVGVNQPAELTVLAAQLRAAIESQNGTATHNADVLVEAVATGEGGEYLDARKIKTLHELTALPAIRQMNREAARIIKMMDLRLVDYDVPGGHDADPADHSTAR